MSDIDELIDRIIREAIARGSRTIATARVYGDEPILRRGSQLDGYVPDRIAQMRRLGRSPEARSWSDAQLFVRQARLMEDFEDDFPFHGTFQSYFPTYDAMSNQQLRGYFSWRTRVRRGTVERTSASFAYVYLYELLNGVGVTPGRQGLDALVAFWQAFREFEPGMDRYLNQWLQDYVAWHGLDPTLVASLGRHEHNAAIATLKRAEDDYLAAWPRRRSRKAPYTFDVTADERLFDALDVLSSYRPKVGMLYRDNPDDLRRVCCASVMELARHQRSGGSGGLTESLFGTRHPMAHLMFASAVFAPDAPHPDCVYIMDDTCSYECHGGLWTRDTYQDGGGRNARLGQALRLCDRRLREELGYGHPLKERGEPKYLARIVDREIADYLAWKEAHAPVRVEVDLSKLAGIRRAAASTRESLLLDEEREGFEELGVVRGAGAVPGEGAVAVQAADTRAPDEGEPAAGTILDEGEPSPELGLTSEEETLLRALLAGDSATGTSDLVVDSINEKLLDLLGDTALEFGPDGLPHLVEDYADEVASTLGA